MARSGTTFGVHLPTRIFSKGKQQPASSSLLLDTVDAAKEAGFASVWVTDHIVYMDPWLDCLLLLAVVAGRAGEHGLTIATGVVGLPLRHPVAMAQSFATLDILSNGHLVIGVGEGSTKLDFDALGLPFDERRKMVVDGVVALRSLLSQKGVSHHGPYYSFDNVTVSPRSIQRPCPPIWLSSWGSPVGLRRVARLGDGWVSSAWHATPEDFNDAWQILSTALGDQGRNPATFPNAVNTMFMYVDEDGDRARQVAVPIIEAATGTPFDGDSGHFIVGDYAECRALARRWIDAGAKEICVWPLVDAVEQIRRFGRHVLQELRATGG